MTDIARASSEPSSQAVPVAPVSLTPPSSGGGLTGAAAIVLVAVVTFVVGLLSSATGHGFGAAFNIAYLVVVLYAAVRVRIADRFTAVVAPPLVYALTLLIAGRFDTTSTAGHGIKVLVENTFLDLSLNAPWLVGATIASIVIVLVRGRRAVVRRNAR